MADTDADGLDVPPPPYVEISPEEFLDPSTNPIESLEPPSVPRRPSPHPSISEYSPIEYNIDDAQKFYGSLISENGHPSKILCRMSDALFFHVNNNCPRADLRGTQLIEPSKLLWLVTAPENDVFDLGKNAVRNLSMIYDAASIPYSLNNSGLPVLDRRAFFYWTTFEIRANPDECHPFWNKMLNIFKLVDPLTNIAFPTPLMRANFPAASVPTLENLRKAWQKIAAFQVQRRQRMLGGQHRPLEEPQGTSSEAQEWHMDDTQRALNRLALKKEQRQQVRKALKAGSAGRSLGEGETLPEASAYAAQPPPPAAQQPPPPAAQQPPPPAAQPPPPAAPPPPPIPHSSRPIQRGFEVLRPFLTDLQAQMNSAFPSHSFSSDSQSQASSTSGLFPLARLNQLRPDAIRKAVKQEVLRRAMPQQNTQSTLPQ